MSASRIHLPSRLHATDAAPASSVPAQAAIDPLLTVREGAAMLGISVSIFWRRVADGTIPKLLKLGGGARWPKSELLAVIEALKARRAT